MRTTVQKWLFRVLWLAFVGFGFWAIVRSEGKANRDETLTNRVIGREMQAEQEAIKARQMQVLAKLDALAVLGRELADVRVRTEDQIARSRDTNAVVRAVADKLGLPVPATRPANP